MSESLQQRVSALPEVYQTIYGHPEWSEGASRDCFDRLTVIGDVYDRLSAKLGRPLKVLDLGCAQGFFSLSLAAKGATVHGVDFLEENISVCNGLRDENLSLDVTFEKGRIEEIINAMQPGDYDLAMGLSVFHHIVHIHGIEPVQAWLNRLAECTSAIILELALRQEPLYWGPSQPADPRELLTLCAFFHQIGNFDTHLSDVYRPLYVISNHYVILGEHCQAFESWRDKPYNEAQGAHKRSRRYYFGDDFVAKVFNYRILGGDLLNHESKRNYIELDREIYFLANPPEDFPTPRLFGHGQGEKDGWLMMERLQGKLLLDALNNGQRLDADVLLSTLLQQLVALEQAGLYHDDVRTWNILINDRSEARLIDFGSISSSTIDCVWPKNLLQSFFILVNEIFLPLCVKLSLLRPMSLSPFNLPAPYSNWLYALWQRPVDEWTFVELARLFEQRHTLPSVESALTGSLRWIAAIESGMQIYQRYLYHLEGSITDCFVQAQRQQQSGHNELLAQLEQQVAHISHLESRVHNLEENANRVEESFTRYPKEPQRALDTLMPLPPDVEELIARLARDNRALEERTEALLHSRSWRLTRPYRYAGTQAKLLRIYGLNQRCRHLARCVIKAVYAQVKQRPALKNRLLHLLRKTGKYDDALSLYHRLYPQPAPAAASDTSVTAETLRSELEIQFNDLNRVPTEVRDIYQQIKSYRQQG